jgi:hypothetical protein
MMPTEVSRKVHSVMAREMGTMGKFIIGKQCKDMGLNPDALSKDDLQGLAKALAEVMLHFGGKEKATKVADEIRRIE